MCCKFLSTATLCVANFFQQPPFMLQIFPNRGHRLNPKKHASASCFASESCCSASENAYAVVILSDRFVVENDESRLIVQQLDEAEPLEQRICLIVQPLSGSIVVHSRSRSAYLLVDGCDVAFSERRVLRKTSRPTWVRRSGHVGSFQCR